MTSYYRTLASLGVLLGINIAVRLFNIPVVENMLLGNHLVEAAAALAIVAFLVDLRIINGDIQRSYFKIGLIAFSVGIIMVAASFSALFVWSEFVTIVSAWFVIAPQIIFLIGLPSLYMADKLSQKNKLFGIDNVGTKGLRNIFILATAYAMVVLYLLNKYGYLILFQ